MSAAGRRRQWLIFPAMKKAVEADPAAAMQASLDASMAEVKRRLLHILFWVVLVAGAAAAIVIYLRGRG